MNYRSKMKHSIGHSFLRSPHLNVWELPKQGANFLTHTEFLPSIGNRALPVLVILIHPNADYAGKNILLTWANIKLKAVIMNGINKYLTHYRQPAARPPEQPRPSIATSLPPAAIRARSYSRSSRTSSRPIFRMLQGIPTFRIGLSYFTLYEINYFRLSINDW